MLAVLLLNIFRFRFGEIAVLLMLTYDALICFMQLGMALQRAIVSDDNAF